MYNPTEKEPREYDTAGIQNPDGFAQKSAESSSTPPSVLQMMRDFV
jgi:hypothetical protein